MPEPSATTMKVTAMAANVPAMAALQENGVLLASSPAGTMTSRSIKVVSVMGRLLRARSLASGEPRLALDSSQSFNNPAGIEFRCASLREEPRCPAAGSDGTIRRPVWHPSRGAPQDVPDSLPKRDEGTDVMPDDVRRSDRSQRMPPDSLPPMDEQSIDRREDPRGTR